MPWPQSRGSHRQELRHQYVFAVAIICIVHTDGFLVSVELRRVIETGPSMYHAQNYSDAQSRSFHEYATSREFVGLGLKMNLTGEARKLNWLKALATERLRPWLLLLLFPSPGLILCICLPT